MSRRKFLISAAASGALGATLYKDMLSSTLSMRDKGVRAKDAVYGNSLDPNDGIILPSVCNGCVTHCGVRVRLKDNKVLRVLGNPYSLLSSDPNLAMQTSLKDAQKACKSGEIKSSVCARGNLVFDKLSDSSRITQCLKRAGKRGENKWISISPEQLISEIANGGDLFGEGQVKGLKQIYNHDELIDPNAPEFGKKANGLCIIATGDEGRKAFFQERFQKSFGTINFHGHTATCGLSMRSGMAAFCDDFNKYPHLKPDFDNCEFLINFASAPAQAGNPFKRQGLKIANYKAENKEYATITPVLTNSTSSAARCGRWIAIRPGGDLALAMALIRRIIQAKIYDESYLSCTNEAAALKNQHPSFCNAAFLVVCSDSSRYKKGEFLRINQETMCLENGKLVPTSSAVCAEFDFCGKLEIDGEILELATSFNLLKQSANEFSVEELLQIAQVKTQDFEYLIEKITQHKGKIGIDLHGGTMQTTGFYTTYAILELVALLGCMNKIGGMSAGGGKYNALSKEFELAKYKGKIKPSGTRIDKTKKPYEATSEYKNHIANGTNAYPAKLPWYPLTNAICTDAITNAANGYPYKIDCLLSWNANVAYASNMKNIHSALANSEQIPLFIAIDPFINETSVMADYIVPDSVMFETWGVVSPWGGSLVRANHFRYPIVSSPNVKFANGQSVCMDSFIIELGLALNLPGFGKNAIDGKFDLFKPSDFYLRSFVNVALDGGFDYEIDEAEFANLPFIDELRQISPKHYKKALFCMARGGKFEDLSRAYKDGFLAKKYPKCLAMYNETLALCKDSQNGQNYSGVPRFYEQRYKDAKTLDNHDLRAFSYKSNIFSSLVGASSALTHLRYSNYIEINTQKAKELGLKDGDLVRVIRDDKKIIGILRTRSGIHFNALGIEHARARRGEGAADFYIDGKLIAKNTAKASGVSISNIIPSDEARGKNALISDFVIGSVARQGFGVKIEKISSLIS